MDTDKELVGKRLRETFGSSSQESVAKILCTSQGNISKWIAGKAYPSTENLLLISKHFNVSIDWLLGLSEQKNITTSTDNLSYESCTKFILRLIQRDIVSRHDDEYRDNSFYIKDLVLSDLVNKGLSLRKTDKDFYNTWLESRLSIFRDTDIPYAFVWGEDELELLELEASNETDLLKVYVHAKEIEKEYDEAMSDDSTPEG